MSTLTFIWRKRPRIFLVKIKFYERNSKLSRKNEKCSNLSQVTLSYVINYTFNSFPLLFCNWSPKWKKFSAYLMSHIAVQCNFVFISPRVKGIWYFFSSFLSSWWSTKLSLCAHFLWKFLLIIFLLRFFFFLVNDTLANVTTAIIILH